METKDTLFDDFKKSDQPPVPEGYFEHLAGNLLSQIKEESHPKPRLEYRRTTFWFTAAAVLTGVIFGLRYFMMSGSEMEVQELTQTELLAYVEEHIEDFEAEDLLVKEVAILKTTKRTEDQPIETNDKKENILKEDSALTREDLLHYLNSQELEVEDLEEIY